ncbi:glycerate kinase type-2 family protein [Polynucleobacter sphagniphilus]|jgi:hydroxypyruvate reductase|uniref:Glycerate 2-kinase n=1 Tax=Polynucleobacter sphagniphilus TaxID=1743169 RepID=A0AA43M6J7_9BURK|nr:glycerate kinase [Polynucleobacter sphagniphilus]MDH6155186.1 glycerate 2-kinase [Polynucleobacter sphagniphilus]MDH6241774.1 glycerate 2-kinase [Polynucleobacter sphagniphilus]MDH6248793.1 glycerate 2-kinase [Polynucleobacter sphagniphilus]MDH6299698.1 glycerate 2-kinase [Polynucleobacter sphagniphilus]MDH6301339.1 glycerate 2-kinase [Polynucleobacter sphagniphilus]
MTQETILKNAFAAALAVADPQKIVPEHLGKIFPNGLSGRCVVVGAGKASASMASALERHAKVHWPEAQLEGVVLTRYGHGSPTSHIKIIEAGHPVPDQAGMDGAKAIFALANQLQQGDVLIALVSGGGSSLLTLPQDGISIDDMRITTQALLRSGAPIEEMNIVRKHLSAILGGNLARVAIDRGARVEALLISDVTGDSPADIASGPCAADYSSYQDALDILAKYHLNTEQVPTSVLSHLQKGVAGQIPETLKETDLNSAHVVNHVIATAHNSLEAAATYIKSVGYQPIILGDTITGEARDVALVHAAIARELSGYQSWAKPPVALISGGECTVTLPPGIVGRGGRCSEFLLALLAATPDMSNIAGLAADTDGIDGSEKNAGAWFTPETRRTAHARDIRPSHFLAAHDCFGFFADLSALVETGPTLTNVNDFRIILID